ncbi:hypothetical protein AB406_0412 [Riemerella anatipestifer]|uniref:Uncharacterized protein n=1 Tax=Riemerella anatipestifer TaxID=34085 RepID=A0A1S7DQR6_RIEAN|nr:hypothetical protein AB406_0412 [Riemerella anatipestifer]
MLCRNLSISKIGGKYLLAISLVTEPVVHYEMKKTRVVY